MLWLLAPPDDQLHGAVAQLGERLHGMQEVTGSIPVCSIVFNHRLADGLQFILKRRIEVLNRTDTSVIRPTGRLPSCARICVAPTELIKRDSSDS